MLNRNNVTVKNIVLIGTPGCGKSYVGKLLAMETGREFVDMDNELEMEEQCSVTDIFENYGEEYFRDIEERKAKALSEKSDLVISTGGGVVLRRENMTCLRKNGIVFFIERDLTAIISSGGMEKRPLLKNGGEAALKRLYNDRIELYRGYSDFTVNNDGDIKTTIEEIKRRLS